ncbi:DUF397 domain-containing protein [Streptomyces sp. NPDC050610]|uniref:DUF397 domain-containing protein n=1 Tax=Streptomyces sp. NPDC050610 TaxID=3157097 RepID=UPI00342BB596
MDDDLSVATWSRSSYSGANGGNCVEVARGAGGTVVPVRDSKNPQGPVLRVSPEAWVSFVEFAVGCEVCSGRPPALSERTAT